MKKLFVILGVVGNSISGITQSVYLQPSSRLLIAKSSVYVSGSAFLTGEVTNECGQLVVEDTLGTLGTMNNNGFVWSKQLLYTAGVFHMQHGAVVRAYDFTNQGSFSGEGRVYIEHISKQEGVVVGSLTNLLSVYDATPTRAGYAFDVPFTGSQSYSNVVVQPFSIPTFENFISQCDLIILPSSQLKLHAIAVGNQVIIEWHNAAKVEMSYNTPHSWIPVIRSGTPSAHVRFSVATNGLLYVRATGFSNEQRTVLVSTSGNKPVQFFTTTLQYRGIAHTYDELPRGELVIVRDHSGQGMKIVR